MKKLFITLTILIVFILSFFIFSKVLEPKNTTDQSIIYSDQLSKIDELEIKSTSSISITTSDSKDLKISLSGESKFLFPSDSPKLTSKIENGNLLISNSIADKKDSTIGVYHLSLKIDIPKTFKNKIFVKSKNGPINIENTHSNNIECNSESGDIKISTIKMPMSINATAQKGNIELLVPKEDKFYLSYNSKTGKIKNELDMNVDNSISDKKINLSAKNGYISLSSNNFHMNN